MLISQNKTSFVILTFKCRENLHAYWVDFWLMWFLFSSHQCLSVWGKLFCICSDKDFNYKKHFCLFTSSLWGWSVAQIDHDTFFFFYCKGECELFETYFCITFQILERDVCLPWHWLCLFVWHCVCGTAQRAFSERRLRGNPLKWATWAKCSSSEHKLFFCRLNEVVHCNTAKPLPKLKRNSVSSLHGHILPPLQIRTAKEGRSGGVLLVWCFHR